MIQALHTPKQTSYLDPIIRKKQKRLAALSQTDVSSLSRQAFAIQAKPLNFKAALKRSRQIAIIGEIKKASPSLGLIQEQFHPAAQAKAYQQAGIAAISVLTEQDYFLGCPEDLVTVVESVSLPVLRKDFIIDIRQIYEARLLGASAVLLICAILDESTLRTFIHLINDLGMQALVEVHHLGELMMALSAGADIIGINNRNLTSFQVDLSVTERIAGLIPGEKTIVSESGIKTAADLASIYRSGADAALIGETLMRGNCDQDTICEKVSMLRGALPG